MTPRDRYPRDTLGDRETSDDAPTPDGLPSRNLTPVRGIHVLDTEVIVLKGIVKKHETRISELEEWQNMHNLHHATTEAVLKGDGKTPGQLDRIESAIKAQDAQVVAHNLSDVQQFGSIDRRFDALEQLARDMKIRIATTVAVVTFLAVAAIKVAGWVGFIK